MNGCRYCVIVHNRKRRGRKRARGIAMCLAQEKMTRCHKKCDERGPGCEYHDAKLYEAYKQASTLLPVMPAENHHRQQRTSGTTRTHRQAQQSW
jgi:hypothetical protein